MEEQTQNNSSAQTQSAAGTTPHPPQDNSSKIEEDLKQAQQKALEMEELAKRTMADLQNFKRRTEEEKSGLMVFANLQFLQAIFPVIDNFQRAMQHIPEALMNDEWVKGIFATEKQFIETLEHLGLKEIDCKVGKIFDPNQHEVVIQTEGEKDHILECFEKGYSFKGKTIRPAKIKVGDGSKK